MRSNPILASVIGLAVLATSLALNAPASAATYYVRTSGNDLNLGLLPATAFRTIQKAATVAKAGDKVWVGAGTYTEAISVGFSGTSGSPIVFLADLTGAMTGDSGPVVVSGSGASFVANGKDYIQVIGIQFGGSATVRWTSSKGGALTGCDFFNGTDGFYLNNSEVTLDNCKVRNQSQNGILVEGTSTLTVRKSTITDCIQKGVYIRQAKSVVIEETLISKSGNHGLRTEANNASDKLDVRRCRISDNNVDGIHLHGNSKMTFENCLIANNAQEGIHNHLGNGNVTINHCTLVGNGDDGLDNDSGTFICTMTNTITAFNGDDGIDTAGSKFTHSYNLSFGNSTKNWNGTSPTTGCISSDPKFISMTDFDLQAGSAAIDKGIGNMSVDIDGVARPLGTAVDIGCYEGPGAGVPIPPPTGKEYFVRKTGSDLKNGRTPATAFRTITKATTVVKPGDTVWVGAGSYLEAVALLAKVGTVATPFRFIADKSGAKTGDKGDVVVEGGFYVLASSYVTMDGFSVQVNALKPLWSPLLAGAHSLLSSNTTFQNLTITGGAFGIHGWDSPNLQLSNCTAQGASTHGFCFWGSTSVTVQDCQSIGNAKVGYFLDRGNAQISNSRASGNGLRGFQFNLSRGSLANCSSMDDALGPEFIGATDPNSITISNLIVENSSQGGTNLRNCTAVIVGGSRPLCTAGSYGIDVNNADLTLRDAVIRSTQYGVQASNNSTVRLTNCQISSCVYDAVYSNGCSATLSNCTITGCRHGVRSENNGTLSATTTTFDANNSWAINHTGYGSISGCVVNNCYQGLYLVGATKIGDITIGSTTIQGTTREGLVAIRCTGDVVGGTDKLSKAGSYGAYLLQSALKMTDIQIAGPQYGIQSYNSNLELIGSTISGCQYDGLYMDAASATLTGSTISGCRYGVRGENSSTLVAATCTLSGNSAWGIQHTGFGSVADCVLSNNAQGLYLAGATKTGDVTISNTKIEGTTGEGLVAIRCTGNLVAGSDKLSKGGGYGAYLSESNLQMTDIAIAGPQYGIQSFNSTLGLSGALISDCALDGLYMDQATSTLTSCTFSGCRDGVRGENSSVLTANSCVIDSNKGWGINHAGKGSITDCLVNNNYQGLYLLGAAATGDITLTNTTIQGTTREGLVAIRCTGDVVGGTDKLSKAGSYGAYLSQSNLKMTNIQIAGPSYGIMSYTSTLDLNGSTVSDCPFDGIYSSQANTTLNNCTLARCRIGFNGENASTLVATSSTVDACTTWGISHAGYGSITNCVVNNCNQGMYLTGVSQATDIQIADTKIQGSPKEGLVAILCSGEVVGGTDKLSKGGSYGAYLSQSNLKLTGISVTGALRGVVSLNSTVTVTDSTVSGTGQTGIYTEASTVTLTNSTVAGCGTRGVDCQLDSNLIATSSKIENCSDWGLVVAGFGTINSCQVNNNQYGASLTGKSTRGDIKLANLTISGSADQGLVAVRCDGTVQGGADPLSKGGSWGVYSSDSKLTLSNATIDGPSYGVQSLLSDLSLKNLRIVNAGSGVYSDRDQNLLMETTRLENCSQWAVEQHQGKSQVRNCVAANTASGLLLDNPNQANVWNTTVVGASQYGLYQNAGVSEVKNTILVGNNQGAGMYRAGGTLTSSHNLVYGFAANFTGITPDRDTLSKNPRFSNAAAGDYRLAKGSPAINAGADLLGYVDSDMVGNPRPTYKRWEIGAYEFPQENGSVRILQWAEKR